MGTVKPAHAVTFNLSSHLY